MSETSPTWRPTSEDLAWRRRVRARRRRRIVTRLLTRWPMARRRGLPDFLLIGASKCGTTALHAWLASSPHVRWALRKEALFFDRTWQRGARWYRCFFPLERERRAAEARDGRPLLFGEGTPDYLFHPHAPRRVQALLPDVKLVVALRNPVDRAWSFYRHQRSHALEPLSFEEAIEREEERLAGELERMEADERYQSPARQNASYLARGRYAEQLERWLALFPAERLHVVVTEELAAEPQPTCRALTSFLGLPPIPTSDLARSNVGPDAGPMAEPTRARLVEHFRPHNARLEALLGRRFAWDR